MKQWQFFVRQPLHLFLYLLLCTGMGLAGLIPGFGIYQSKTIGGIVLLSLLTGALHQLWILVFWRLELNSAAVSRRFGAAGFLFYCIGFAILILARLASIVLLAPLNRGTLPVPLMIRLILLAIIAGLNIWGMYSVLRYFGIRRAFGLDHFDPAVRQTGLVKGGAYRYTGNVMYLLVLPVFFAPGLLWDSIGSIALGVFHFLLVWVHYLCTELPDMAKIYGPTDHSV